MDNYQTGVFITTVIFGIYSTAFTPTPQFFMNFLLMFSFMGFILEDCIGIPEPGYKNQVTRIKDE